MTKKEQMLISIGAMTGGLLLCGYALATTFGEPASTICIVSGLVFAVSGFISFILALKKPTLKR